MSSRLAPFPSVVSLNVGGSNYTTSLATLTKFKDSLITEMFTGESDGDLLQKDESGQFFIDRDGFLFRFILDYLRTGALNLPDNFQESTRLYDEARFYRLPGLIAQLGVPAGLNKGNNYVNGRPSDTTTAAGKKPPGFLTIGYRGTFAFGRDGLADVKFRKVMRILVCGRVSLAREVFGENLNESRDPDRGQSDRYSARFYLKHIYLEQAFDVLAGCGFRFLNCCASGTSAIAGPPESEESRWNHYNEFIFQRA
ncbi:putative BTB/POZ domain-containing protein KCTD12-like [Apostichopus japonicus]|uniref:Putative BTB/POZ domain-containing protein KCTD12-like n=1 Tax=Stichopus japonicus TaxID=307972 RepID=A0A2G8KP27_STIJA|nr:putative BTB/POZ domain-containing protein KCTD12-like [Apostichopus japonicus]